MKYRLFLSAATLALASLSCSNPSKPVGITETREAPAAPAVHDLSVPPAATAPPMEAPQRAYKWVVPEGWMEASPTPMRIGNFRVGEGKQTECYVTVLKGTGGGTEMNVNRWRGQMGVEGDPLNAEAIGKLPKIPMLGKEVPLVEVPGTYQGMSGETKTGYMLLGSICELGDESVFVKMIGPESVVRAEHEKFIAFCGSLK